MKTVVLVPVNLPSGISEITGAGGGAEAGPEFDPPPPQLAKVRIDKAAKITFVINLLDTTPSIYKF